MIDLDIDIRNQPEFKRALRALGKSVTSAPSVRKMLRPGAKPIRDAIRAVTPVSKSPHYYYRNGKRIATFLPGHLRKSAQDIANRKRSYKKVPAIYIGPVFTRNAGSGGTFGNTVKNVDAYYAHMVYGSALAYEKKVIDAGYRAAKGTAEGLIILKVRQVIEDEGKKTGFR